MNNFTILFACCVALCILTGLQGPVCGISDPLKKQNTCTNTIGGISCVICCGSIFYILSRK